MTEVRFREMLKEAKEHIDALSDIVREYGVGDGCAELWIHSSGYVSLEGKMLGGWEYRKYNTSDERIVNTISLSEEKEGE